MKRRDEAAATMARVLLGSVELVAVDVGAARGLLPHWEPLARLARLFLVEPDESAIPAIRARLDDLGATAATMLPFGLSEHGGRQTLHRVPIRTSSSLLVPNLPDALDYAERDWLVPYSPVEIETRTLSDVLDEQAVPRLDMIKLDTQGTELAILRGLGDRARRLTSLEIEVGTADGYVDQATLGDVLAFAERCGLELFDLIPKRSPMVHDGTPGFYERLFGTYRRSPSPGTRLTEVDALFMRKRSLVLDSGDPAETRRLAVALAVHGKFAQAHRLAELAAARKILSPADLGAIEEALVTRHRKVFMQRVAVDVAGKLVGKLGERLAVSLY